MWYYHRNNCDTCEKSQAFLTKHKINPTETVDARKTRLGPAEAIKLARSAAQLIATRGAKLITFDMKKDNPTDDDILAVILGPSGNLRAPAIRVGPTLLIGFNKDAYEAILTSRVAQ